MPCTSQAPSVMAVKAASSEIGVHNVGNPSGGRTILGSAICTLPMLHYETGIKSKVENAKHCQRGCQGKNQVGLGQ